MLGFALRHGLFLFIFLSCVYPIFTQIRFGKGSPTVWCGARSVKEKLFLEAVSKGNLRLVEQLLQKGADPNLKDDCGNPVIVYPSFGVQPALLKLLVKSGANVNVIADYLDLPPLLLAIREFGIGADPENIYESLRILIEAGADVNLRGNSDESALILSVMVGEEKLTEMLLAAGADVNYKDNEDRTAYSYAAEDGNQKLKKILFDNGADITIGVDEYKKEYGENAFFQASADGRTDVVEAMLASGTDVNLVNTNNMTALMRATEDSTVDLLLSAGADVNIKDSAGFTALIWAAAFRRNNHVLKLIAAGANVNAKTNEGRTALDFVTDGETREALIRAGAKEK